MIRLSPVALWNSGRSVVALTHRTRLSSFAPLAKASFERPTPIVLVSAEGVNNDIWDSLVLTLSSNGYSGTRIPHPSTCGTFYDAADEIQRQITTHKYTPPVLVAHSAASYAAQKFLESYPLSGLILVNPVPPYSAQKAILALQHRWVESGELNGESAGGEHLVRYFGLPASTKHAIPESGRLRPETAQPFLSSSEALTMFLTAVHNPDAKVNLERGSVPTLIITSDGDRELLTNEDINTLLELHAVSPEDALHFGSNPFPGFRSASDRCPGTSARAPMLTHTEEFNTAVLEWIETVT